MLKINKDFSLKTIAIAITVALLFTSSVYSYTYSNNTLRLHIGARDNDDTFGRMGEHMREVARSKEQADLAPTIRATPPCSLIVFNC